MRQAVVIGATSADSPWLADLMESLAGCRWEVQVHLSKDWELSTIAWAALQWDEFVFLPQSTVVLDQQVFDICFRRYAGYGVNLGTAQGLQFRMYLGKYRTETLRAVGIPVVHSKVEAVRFEDLWCTAYAVNEALAGRLVSVGGPLEHTNTFVERHGRTNMVVENEYLRRYKSCWDGASLEREIRRLRESSGNGR